MQENPSPKPGLARALGPVMATAVVVGTVIGAGIFRKPQSIAQNVEYFGITALCWIIGGVLSFVGGLALAEVAVLYPKAGGNYVYLREGYGRLVGFLWGWVEFWMIRSASIGALATVFTESLNDTLAVRFPQADGAGPIAFWPRQFLTIGVIIGLSLVNMRGVRWGGLLQLCITLVKVASLLAIALLPFCISLLIAPTSAIESVPVPQPHPEYLQPIWPSALTSDMWSKIATAFLGVLWAYHGWMNVAPIAEEIRQPQRNIPLALLLGIGIVTLLYLGANLGYYLMLPREEIADMPQGVSSVAALFGLKLLGPIGTLLASGAIMFSAFGALNGNIMVGPRLLYAMGQDKLAPQVLSEVHPRFQTPVWAIMVLSGWSCLLVLGMALLVRFPLPVLVINETWTLNLNVPAKKTLFDVLTDFAMFGAIIFETLAVMSLFVFRKLYPQAERPYRCPGYPWLPMLYMLLPACLLVNYFVAQRAEALLGLGFIGLGVLVYRWGLRVK